LASSAPASTASPPRSTSSSTGKLAAPTSSSTGLEWWTAGGRSGKGKVLDTGEKRQGTSVKTKITSGTTKAEVPTAPPARYYSHTTGPVAESNLEVDGLQVEKSHNPSIVGRNWNQQYRERLFGASLCVDTDFRFYPGSCYFDAAAKGATQLFRKRFNVTGQDIRRIVALAYLIPKPLQALRGENCNAARIAILSEYVTDDMVQTCPGEGLQAKAGSVLSFGAS